MDLMWEIIIAILVSLVIFAAVSIISGDILSAFTGSGGLTYG